MRDILFRGKRIDNGEWVEGSLLHDTEQNESYIAECFEDKAAYIRQVIPETVGQYTGLTANGKKIFEGDIVCWPGTQLRDVVQYGEFNCSCCDGVYGWSFGSQDIRSYDCYDVIGNIHDNPELLGGVDDG